MTASTGTCHWMRSGVASAALALAVSLSACAGPESGDLRDRGPGLVPTGAADEFDEQLAIPIAIGETSEGQAGGTAFTLYQLQLSRGTAVRARLDQTSGDLAPMAFLYSELDALARPESFIAPSTFDYGDAFLEIEWPVERGGTYYLVVRAFDETRGDFRLTLSGTEVTGPPLTDAEEAQVADSLDQICPDTFCGGDLNYRVDSLSCDGAGRCDLGLRAQWYGEEDGFGVDVLEGRDESELRASGACEEGGTFEARLTGTDGDEDGVWVEVACGLVGDFYTFEDIAESRSYGLQYSDRLYTSLLDCVDAVEGLVYSL